MKKKKKKYNQGGALLGAGAGAATALIPGGAPFAPLVSGAVTTLFSGKQKEPKPPTPMSTVPSASYGFRQGGRVRAQSTSSARAARPTTTSQHRAPAAARPADNRAPRPGRTSDNRAARPQRTSAVRYQEGGALVGARVGGRHHEAGGVNMEEFGMPDVEVERDEALMFDATGNPDYVFSNLKMKGTSKTFADEFGRLTAKGDLAGIRNLQKKQEKEMGREIDVTMPANERQATMAKYGGKLNKMQTGGRFGDSPPVTVGFRNDPNTLQSAFNLGRAALRTGINHLRSNNAAQEVPTAATPTAEPHPNMQYKHGAQASPAAVPAPVEPHPNMQYVQNRYRTPDRNTTTPVSASAPASPATAPAATSALSSRQQAMTDWTTAGQQEAAGWRMPGAVMPGVAPTTNTQPLVRNVDGSPAGAGNVVDADVIEEQEESRSFLDRAGAIAPYAADAFNAIQTMRMRPPKRAARMSPSHMDDRVSTAVEEEAVMRGQRAITGDPSATGAQRLAAFSQGAAARNQVFGQANQRRDQIRNVNVGIDNQERQQAFQATDMQNERDAQFKGARATALSNIIRGTTNRLEMRNYAKQMQEMEPFQISALLYSLPTEQRRDMIEELSNSLPAWHPSRKQLQNMLP